MGIISWKIDTIATGHMISTFSSNIDIASLMMICFLLMHMLRECHLHNIIQNRKCILMEAGKRSPECHWRSGWYTLN